MEKKNNKLVIILLIIGCVVIIALSAVIVNMLMNNNSNNNTSSKPTEEQTQTTEALKTTYAEETLENSSTEAQSSISDIIGYWHLKLNGYIHGAYIYQTYDLEILDKGIIGYDYGTLEEAFRVGVEDITISEKDNITIYSFTIPQMLLQDGTTAKYFKQDMASYIYYDKEEKRLVHMAEDLESGNYVLISEMEKMKK